MTVRHNRAGIEDRWHKKQTTPNGTQTVPSTSYGIKARWRVRWVKNGKEYTKVFARKPDAQKHLTKVLAELDKPDLTEGTFRDAAEKWIATKNHRKPTTLAGYNSILNNLALPRWADTPLQDINYENYTAWLGEITKHGSQKGGPLSPSRVIQTHQLMGAVLGYAVKTGRLNTNVALQLKRSEDLPIPTEAERRYLTHEELITLANNIPRFQALTLILGYCGIRFGEAAALRRRHVGNKELVIRSSASYATGEGIVETATKTHRSRHVPVPQPVWDILVEQLPEHPGDLLFPSKKGTFLPIEEYRNEFDKGCALAGINDLTPHGLRHTCASLAISAGANVKVVQRLLGHATAAMTLDKYGHLFDDDLGKVSAALSTAIESSAVSLRASTEKRTKAS